MPGGRAVGYALSEAEAALRLLRDVTAAGL
jgi:hypothetical protein